MLRRFVGSKQTNLSTPFLFLALIPLVFSLSATARGGKTIPVIAGVRVPRYPVLPESIIERIRFGKREKKIEGESSDRPIPQDWALTNIGFFEVFSRSGQPIHPGVHACSPDIVVAVIDTGLDYTHPKLRESLWVNSGESGSWSPPSTWLLKTSCLDKSCNGIDDDKNGFIDDVVGWDFVHEVNLPYDTHGHGTHISGIIAASANPSGGTGVCPRVAIMPLKYYDNSGAGYNNLTNTVRAIQYAVRNGAQVINYSGGGADPAPAEREAVQEAMNQGILFVAAAGNDGHNNDQFPYYPASYRLDNIIAVASLNRQNELLPSSNFGKTVDLAAPGLAVMSTLPGGKFGTMSGTSQATAFTTGVAAALASQLKQKNIQYDYKKVKSWLLEGIKGLRGNERKNLVSYGILSVSNAFLAQQKSLESVIPVMASEIASRNTSKKSVQ